MSTYIQPNIMRCSTFEEVKRDSNYGWFDKPLQIEEIYGYEKSFVFAEPGFGKTRLLEEMFNYAEKKGDQCIILDLKRIAKLEYSDLEELIFSSDYDFIEKDTGISRSKKFEKKSKAPKLFFLDALDEVKVTELDRVINHIIQISNDNKTARIIVTARTNRSEKYLKLINKLRFSYIKILKFDRNQLKNYLDNNIDDDLENNKREKIANNIQNINNETVLIPRYLNYLIRVVQEDPGFFLKNIKRSDIMEKVLLKKLKPEDDEHEERMQLRVFGKLALSMEIHQTKEISADDFINFFEIIDSKVCERAYYRKSIEELYHETVLKYNHGWIGFENSEIQEYLAARELNLMDDSENCLYNIITDNPASIIFPYWKNTLSYFVEMNPSILLHILRYDYRSDVNHQSSVTEIINFVDISKFTKDELSEIGKLIYNHYKKIAHWIPINICSRLGEMMSTEFLVDELLKYREYDSNIANFVIGNQLRLLAKSVENKKYSEEKINQLKHCLKKLIQDSAFLAIQRHSLTLLAIIGNLEDIKDIYSYLNKSEELIEREIIRICSEKYSDSEFAIQRFYEILLSKNYAFTSLYAGIMNIKESQFLIILLNKLIDDDVSLSRLLDHSSHNYHRPKMTLSINLPSQKLIQTIGLTIKNILRKPDLSYYIRSSDFIHELIKLYDRLNPTNSFNLYLDFIEEDRKDNKRNYTRYYNDRYLISILSEKNSNEIFRFLENSDNGLKILESFAVALYWSDNEKYRKYNEKIESIIGVSVNIKNNEKDEGLENYNEFKSLLHINEAQYNTSVFAFFCEHFETIIEKIKKEEKQYIQDLAKRIINEINIENVKITREDNRPQYTITRVLIYYPYVLKTLSLLRVDISDYRENILALIPYIELYSTPEIITEVLGDLSDSDVEKMILAWEKIDDSAFDVHALSVLRFLKSTGINSDSIYNLLMELFNRKKYEDYEAIEFIELLNEYKLEETFLIQQLGIYGRDTSVGFCINKKLIEENNLDAIEWRFNKIKDLAQPFKKKSGLHDVSSFEDEIMSLKVANPVMNIGVEHEDRIIELIEYSFDKYNESDDYYEYANYIWKIVKGYYKNLIEKDYSTDLRKIQLYANQSVEKKGVALFKYHINDIVNYLLEEHTKRFEYSKSVTYLNKIMQLEKIIDNSKDFNILLQKVINEDLRRWVEFEGAYKMMEKQQGKLEDLFQKTIKGQIELACIKKGFQVKVIREPQSLSDKRPDFLLSYGFSGTQLIEVKKLSNPQVQNKYESEAYMDKLKEYLEGHNADNIIYLIVRLNSEKDLESKVKELQNRYNSDSRIIVCGLDGLAGRK